MRTTLNGWPAIDSRLSPRLRTITIPGTARRITVRRVAAPLFAAFLADWHAEMPHRLNLDTGPVEGYNYRPSRLNKGLSNHSSGTAVDLRYDVLFADGKRHMTDEERSVLNRLLNRYTTADGHHVLASGANWMHTIDEMHIELAQAWEHGAKRDTTAADIREVTRRLGIDYNGRRHRVACRSDA